MPDSSTETNQEPAPRTPDAVPAPFWRRLAAMFYDTLIVTALVMVATAIVLPFNQGEAFDAGSTGLQMYLLAIILGFFLFFWRRGGQTLGMRAWKIKLVATSGGTPDYAQLLIRAITACIGIAALGLGVFWSLIDRNKLAVHDHLSKTRLIVITPS